MIQLRRVIKFFLLLDRRKLTFHSKVWQQYISEFIGNDLQKVHYFRGGMYVISTKLLKSQEQYCI